MAAFGDKQLRKLSGLVAQLSGVGFEGTIKLISHTGRFCLGINSLDDQSLPKENTDFTQCDIQTPRLNPAENQQSRSFRRYAAQYRIGSGSRINISLANRGSSNPLYVYPDLNEVNTAGEWNKIAQLNNRVEYQLEPQ